MRILGRLSPGMVALAVKLIPKLVSVAGKLLKVTKVGKVGLAAGSTASYTWLFSWQFALAIMVMLFIHESGHIWAMKRYGMRVKGIYFIPFFGGAAVTESQFPSRKAESVIAIMGPIWGFVLAVAASLVYFATKEAVWAAVAGWMALVNLINLLPINPLDGGRILKSIAFSISSRLGLITLVVGLALATALLVVGHIWIFVILLPIGATETLLEWRRSRHRHEAQQRRAPAIKQLVEETGLREEEIEEQFDRAEQEVIETDSRLKSLLRRPLRPMTRFETLWSAFGYVAVAGVLWGLMSAMEGVPEVDLAREILMD